MNVETLRKPAGSADSADCLARVERIAGVIAGATGHADRERRLAPEALAALHKERLFRLLLPQAYGGDEVNPPTFFQTIEAVAKLDASTAWCLCQGNGCAMTAAYLAPEIADKIWGSDPQGVLAWGPGKIQARPDGDGYRVSGTTAFASGGRHATWLGAHATVIEADGSKRRLPDGSVEVRTMLFPAGDVTMNDIWNVVGLRGTGSDGYTLDEMFVPSEHSVLREDPTARHCDGTLYQFLAMNLYASGFSGTAIGIARSMLDAFKALAAEKTPRLARSRLGDDEVIQGEYAHAEAQLRSARAFILSELNDIWDDVVAQGRLTIEQRMRIRLATTYGIHAAKEVANIAYDLAGASAIFIDNGFEQKFRDIHTVTQQLQGRKSHFRTVGAFLFGHPPDLNVV